jgi:K+-transporting ATPase KdpF subunit
MSALLLAATSAGIDNAVGLVLAVLVAAYLISALVRPERF